MARGICALVSIVLFAVLASSATASYADSNGKAPLPSRRELQQAGPAMMRSARPSYARSRPGRFGPAVRALLQPAAAKAPRRARSSDRSNTVLSALESSLLARVNSVRRQHGLRGLTLSHGLTTAAAYHSKQMVIHGVFEHESRGGGAFWRRIERFYASNGFRSWEVGENLAYGSPGLSAGETVRMWLNSPGHRENLLSKSWREIGLGAIHVASAGGDFAGGPVTVITADFGARLG